MGTRFKNQFFHLWTWWLLATALLVVVAMYTPQTVGVLALKVGQTMFAGALGYQLAHGTLAHTLTQDQRNQPSVAAAIIVGRSVVMLGAMLAVGMGL
jgi:uncharacterized membrane protein